MFTSLFAEAIPDQLQMEAIAEGELLYSLAGARRDGYGLSALSFTERLASDVALCPSSCAKAKFIEALWPGMRSNAATMWEPGDVTLRSQNPNMPSASIYLG